MKPIRRFNPGMRVKKFHEGGKGPGHPHVNQPSNQRIHHQNTDPVEYYTAAYVDDSPAPAGTSYSWDRETGDDFMEAPLEINTSILDDILVEKHGTGEHEFSEFRDAVRHHEGGLQGYSAIQNKRKDGSQGPGRGGYQFGPDDAATAYQRLKNIANDYDFLVPDLTTTQLSNMHTLSPELQDLLFTAHFMNAPNSKVSVVLADRTKWADQWIKGHWSGGKSRAHEIPTRTKSFEASLKSLYPPETSNDE